MKKYCLFRYCTSIYVIVKIKKITEANRTKSFLFISQGEHQGCGSWIWLKLQEVLLHHK